MIQNRGKNTPKMLVVYHAIDHKNIKYFSILDVVRKICKERQLKFILSLSNPIDVGFEVSDTKQLNINLQFAQKSQIEALTYATNNRNRYGYKIVYFVDSLFDVKNIINEYQKQTSNLTVISPEMTPETSAKDILSLCESKSCLIPLFSNIKSHLNLFNTQNPNSSIFVLFVFGDTQSAIMNCSFAINGCKNDMNYMHKISNVHGNYKYLILESAEQRSKTREEREYDSIVDAYLNDDEFDRFTDKNNFTFIDCPGCVHSDYFTMILDMVSPNMKLKVYQNKIVIEDPKMQQMIEKTVKDIASLMPFVGETMFAIEIMNNISLELISIGDQFFTRLLETNSLFFYKFDKHCFDFCLKNINLLNDPDKSLRISYIDKNIPLVLVSNKALQIPSEVIRFNQNPKTEYVCDLRELSQHENIAVDEVIFNPPAYKFHPSLFNSQGAVEFLLEYLRAHDIVCFRDNNKIGMSWQDAQKARNILEEDVEFHPPFKTLNIKKDVSLSLVISKTSEISPYWVVVNENF